jgi:hypothetical protein
MLKWWRRGPQRKTDNGTVVASQSLESGERRILKVRARDIQQNPSLASMTDEQARSAFDQFDAFYNKSDPHEKKRRR